MKAEIISVGTEILLGEILDTNATYIAGRLPPIGIDLYFMAKVGDNLDRLADTIERGLQRSDVILMTGGLGPTEDDLTREAIAQVMGEEMFVDEDAADRLRSFFTARGLAFPERNLKQAMLIPSAMALANPRGTAPGWWVERNDRVIVAMPGPPNEMQRMWEHEVEHRLQEMSGGEILVKRVLKTVGVGESTIDEMVAPLLKGTNPSIGVYAKPDGVYLRLAAKSRTQEVARNLIAPVEEEARRILGDVIWGADDETLEGVIGQMLNERAMTLATMESASGGLLGSTITDVEGSSAYYKGGFVSYTTQMKMSLGVSADLIDQHGVVSAQVAGDMARAARHSLNADWGIGITGVAGPDEVEGNAPGTMHIAVHDGRAPETLSYTFNMGRAPNKRRAVTGALFLLRRSLLTHA